MPNKELTKKVVRSTSGKLAMKGLLYTRNIVDVMRQEIFLSNRDSLVLGATSPDAVDLNNNHLKKGSYFRCIYDTSKWKVIEHGELDVI